LQETAQRDLLLGAPVGIKSSYGRQEAGNDIVAAAANVPALLDALLLLLRVLNLTAQSHFTSLRRPNWNNILRQVQRENRGTQEIGVVSSKPCASGGCCC